MTTALCSRAGIRNYTKTRVFSQRISLNIRQPRHVSTYSLSKRSNLILARQQPQLATSRILSRLAALQPQNIKAWSQIPAARRAFSSTPSSQATYNQVRRGCRKEQRARRGRSPALANRPEMKGVCLKTGITKPKKPNSGERKTARVRLSSGRVITAYIPGEGHNVQQHSVVMVRGGRAQDCPGVKYHLVRGALDLVRLFSLSLSPPPFVCVCTSQA